jgi:hypothetical protein
MIEKSRRTFGNLLFHWLPYIFIAIALGFGLWIVDQSQAQRADDRRLESVANCRTLVEAIDTNKSVLIDVINSFAIPTYISIPEGADEALITAINSLNEKQAVFNESSYRQSLLKTVINAPVPKCSVK